MPPYPPSFFLLLLLLFSAPQFTTSALPRRTLHEPFFPTAAPAPSVSPENVPPPPFPKYPSTTTNAEPFFPPYTSPPSQPSSRNVPSSYPANISSLIFPNPNSAPSPTRRSSGKLVAAVLLPLLAITSIGAALAFFMFKDHRRRINFRPDKSVRSDSQLLFPPYSTPSEGNAPQHPQSEYLYVGTTVSSGGKLAGGGSPELHPLPPLSREFPLPRKQSASDSEEYYSPRLSESRNSRRTFGADVATDMERCGSCSSIVSTPSYPSSGSPPPAAASSMPSMAKSLSSRSNGFMAAEEVNNGFAPAAGPLSPRRPPMRPLTPSPPRRRPLSSPPLCKPGGNSPRSMRSNEFQKNLLPVRKAPTPPPPPPAGYWESQIRNRSACQPPILTPPRSPPGSKDSAAPTVQKNASNTNVDSNERSEETASRPKLKTLHWDKVRASSDRVMVWDQLRSSSFQVNEEMIETLFVCKPVSTEPKEFQKKQVLPSPKPEGGVLDPKKSQNIAILLRALNVTKEEVCEALLEGNTDGLGTELLETLLKMAPTKEEELKLKDYNIDSLFKLGTAEKFLKAILDIPFAFKRMEAMLYIANFDLEVDYLKRSFETLELACEELRSSRLFLKLLEAVLKTGNRMNVGTNRGDARAFKLDTLLKLVDVKGTDGKTTLLHFVVQEIIRAEGSRLAVSKPSVVKTQANILQDDLVHKMLGLQVVSGLGSELSNVKKAAAMDSDVLSSYVSKLAGGITKVHEVLRLNDPKASRDYGIRFQETMDRFLKRAEDEIIKVQAYESVVLSLLKEITEYFHGNSAEEAHPFRIFMVVRDFLSILDRVCKEVGKINEHTSVSSARQFPVPVNPTLAHVVRLHALRPESSDDESSLSAS